MAEQNNTNPMPMYFYNSHSKENVLKEVLKIFPSPPENDISATVVCPLENIADMKNWVHSLDYDPFSLSNLFLTRTHDIENGLSQLVFRMMQLNCLLSKSGSFAAESCNQNDSNIKMPWQLLILFDFPNGYTKDAVSSLSKLLRHGYKFRIFPVLFLNEENPWGWFLKSFLQCCDGYKKFFGRADGSDNYISEIMKKFEDIKIESSC